MRFRPLVALLAGAAVSAVREARARSIEGRGVDNTDNTDHNEHCPHDNLLRCLVGSPTLAYTFCSWSVGIYATPVTLYETVTVPATKTAAGMATGTATGTATQGTETTETTTSAPSSSQSSLNGVSTVTVTQTATQTVTSDHTQTTTNTVVQTVVQTVVVTAVGGHDSGDSSGHGNESLANSLPNSPVNATAAQGRPTPPSRVDRRANVARTTPKTSLACLDDLQPALDGVTSACSCFASSQPTPTTTATVTWVEGAPACPAGRAATRNGGSRPLQQPTFPNCFADFHPYNCGTDHVGQIACSCALTAEGTAQCTLGDYERDNACTTSDDCAAGWYCTVIECFGAGVPSVCTKACPVIFAPPFDGGSDNSTDDGTSNDNAVVSAHPQQTMSPLAQAHALDVSPNSSRNLSIIIVNNDANGFGSGRARGGTHRPGS